MITLTKVANLYAIQSSLIIYQANSLHRPSGCTYMLSLKCLVIYPTLGVVRRVNGRCVISLFVSGLRGSK